MRLIKAIVSAIKTMLQVKEDKRLCKHGHAMHASWSHCPICRLLESETIPFTPKVAIRNRDSYDQRKTVVLGSGSYLIGCSMDCDMVLNPAIQVPSGQGPQYQLVIDDQNHRIFSVQDGVLIRIGNKEYRDSKLYDRDQFNLLGVELELISLSTPAALEGV